MNTDEHGLGLKRISQILHEFINPQFVPKAYLLGYYTATGGGFSPSRHWKVRRFSRCSSQVDSPIARISHKEAREDTKGQGTKYAKFTRCQKSVGISVLLASISGWVTRISRIGTIGLSTWLLHRLNLRTFQCLDGENPPPVAV